MSSPHEPDAPSEAQSALARELAGEMERWEAAGLRRSLDDDPLGGEGVDFTSNDYLSLSRAPELVAAAREALERHGVGGRASRLLGGGAATHDAAERAAAAWLGAEAALLFPSGYQANLGLVGALADRRDALFCDALLHASLVDAARLSRARVHVHAHLDLGELERQLARARPARRRIVLTEGVFSMDGDRAPLAALHALCERHDAWLVVDEAHAVGLLGPEGAGAAADEGLAAPRAAPSPEGPARPPRPSPQDLPEHAPPGAGAPPASMSTAAMGSAEAPRLAARVVTGGKALGAGGALVVGSRALREHLVQHARAFVFTTAPPPALAAALVAAIGLARDPRVGGARRETALARARDLASALGLPAPAAAIVPWLVGSSEDALAAAASLRAAGFDVRAVRPPTVPEGTARLRLVCHAANTAAEVEELARRLRELELAAGGSAAAAPGRAAERRGSDASPRAPRAPHTGHGALGTAAESRRARARRALFVVGTDTGVGKTLVSALLLADARRRGPAAYWKPVQTGAEADTEAVGRLSGARPHELLRPAWTLALPASPHEAAAAEAKRIRPRELEEGLHGLLRTMTDTRFVVELAGGLLVPYLADAGELVTQADWLARARARCVLVARSGLGTLNHTLLTLEALRARHVEPEALFLVGEPHRSNRETLRAVADVPLVLELPRLEPLDPGTVEDWLRDHDLSALFP